MTVERVDDIEMLPSIFATPAEKDSSFSEAKIAGRAIDISKPSEEDEEEVVIHLMTRRPLTRTFTETVTVAAPSEPSGPKETESIFVKP